MILSLSLPFKKLKFSKKKSLEEAEKCLKVLLVLIGREETDKIKSDLYQELTTGHATTSDHHKYFSAWSR